MISIIILICFLNIKIYFCLLYTSDAADERSSVDLGGRRIIKKKKKKEIEKNQVILIKTMRQTEKRNNRLNIDNY